MSTYKGSMKWLKDVTSKLVLLLLVSFQFSNAQDTNYVRATIDTLCSETMFGRGYVNDGHNKAAKFIAEEMKKIGLKPLKKDYLLPFKMNVNVVSSHPEISFDGKKLEAGVDFLVESYSGSVSGEFETVIIDQKTLAKEKKVLKLIKKGLVNKVLILDARNADKDVMNFARSLQHTPVGSKMTILLTDQKLTWGMSQQAAKHGLATVKVGEDFVYPSKVKVDIKTQLKKQLLSHNIAGYIPGKEHPDSFIVFSAHYDHLGGMGDQVFFPGANDNASGTSLVLDLARKYIKDEHLKYSIAFVLFGGEEVGLLGSKDFVAKEIIPLKSIKVVINTDIMGTGDDGIKVVNATNNIWFYEKMVQINEEKNLLKRVGKRGPAANSDHHPFHEKGVPAIFIYTMGGIQAYHDVYDIEETLPLTKYSEVFELITAVVEGM